MLPRCFRAFEDVNLAELLKRCFSLLREMIFEYLNTITQFMQTTGSTNYHEMGTNIMKVAEAHEVPTVCK